MALVSKPSEMRLFLIKVDPLFLIDFMQGIGSSAVRRYTCQCRHD